MKNSILDKQIDEALDAVLNDLARERVEQSLRVTATAAGEKKRTSSIHTKTSRNDSTPDCVDRADSVFAESERERVSGKIPGIIDHKVTLLALAGAAVNAHAEPCLDRIVHELEGTGVTKADIREAVESGRFLGVHPDLAAKVFEGECDEEDEQEPRKTVRSDATTLSAAKRN